eukprot:CAMPEP_0176422374 /NCGR_PEP_ID=MMETSP0127-20121128/9697_1 /TAXON_ID=938130 /ORGANISM="Platyophrya macrostoma, Strain WH" /LENGTH=55 /DNA_ID=CAMNT_0017803215 /DNA_START=141 /DNA_END=308 /DNA_ORIENTATION=-
MSHTRAILREGNESELDAEQNSAGPGPNWRDCSDRRLGSRRSYDTGLQRPFDEDA